MLTIPPPLGTLNISTAVEALCDPKAITPGTLQQAFVHLSVLNMFTMISALYMLTFSLETSLPYTIRAAETMSVQTGLQHWKELWPSTTRDAELTGMAYQNSSALHSWKRVGFIRHAPEYWLLTHLILDRMLKRTHNLTSTLNSTVNINRVGNCEQGEMTQINTLISKLQRMPPISIYDTLLGVSEEEPTHN